nr:MAG TPA: hypothetical protein [Caudoviricetes sp.]
MRSFLHKFLNVNNRGCRLNGFTHCGSLCLI